MSTTPRLMWRPPSATWMTCCARVGSMTVPLPPDVVQPGESSGDFCLSSPPDTSHTRCVARCKHLAFAQLCSKVAKLGDWRTYTKLQQLRRNDPAVICWICGTKAHGSDSLHQIHSFRNLSLRILGQSFAVDGSDGMVQRATSKITKAKNHKLPSPRRKGRPRTTLCNV